MNSHILHKDVQEFINKNLKSDITKLILKGSPFGTISSQELANQLIAKQKSEKKLPTWFQQENIYFPAKISIEQTSSEITAAYKAKLVSGTSIIDITGGFGVDSLYFSKHFKEITHCEINEELSEIVKHNFNELKIKNCSFFIGDGTEYLKNSSEKLDCIYIDPSRRNDIKGKVFLLKDCLPNVPENIDFLFKKTNQILIKNSPILDITSTINELKHVKEVHVIAIKNEVKELLFLLEKGYNNEVSIKTVNFKNDEEEKFEFSLNSKSTSEYEKPLTFLYEPNSAILKSGGFHEITEQIEVKKLHQHSHLYTSETLVEFPGRIFRVINVISYNKKELRKVKKANITTRNFPRTVAQIRKETKIEDGGNTYLFFTTDLNNQLKVIFCNKV
ncbi:spermine/spermidine synthase [Lutibacter sp. Hel_I_33_5]|uniref:class I SAM-dependent methyltransferase n=1 Tax=Lutibacter sp. Hel_I_33_5 TaxID=1566289 RepID=UPI00119EC294|nr:RsmD family RNA methyltransferase [Lutibacter sp. Hel_I_33_5]TVZ55576.1 spermine/spermidine synthase [Lutibacter sp. Hel_I_33_5]